MWVYNTTASTQITNAQITYYYPSSLGTLRWSSAAGNTGWSVPVVDGSVPQKPGYTACTSYYTGGLAVRRQPRGRQRLHLRHRPAALHRSHQQQRLQQGHPHLRPAFRGRRRRDHRLRARPRRALSRKETMMTTTPDQTSAETAQTEAPAPAPATEAEQPQPATTEPAPAQDVPEEESAPVAPEDAADATETAAEDEADSATEEEPEDEIVEIYVSASI